MDNKNEIITDLLKRYEKTEINNNYNKQIKILNNKINIIKQKKDKLLELVINGYIENTEFSKRNDVLSQEIDEYEKTINLMQNQKDNVKNAKNNIEKLHIEIQNELNFDKNIDEYIKLIIDKIIVHKINGSRKHVNLEIFFKLGEKKFINYYVGKKPI